MFSSASKTLVHADVSADEKVEVSVIRETGQITLEYPDSAFIQAVEEYSPASTSEVGEAVGCSSDNAYRRLKALEEDGKMESKMAGNSLIWFPTE